MEKSECTRRAFLSNAGIGIAACALFVPLSGCGGGGGDETDEFRPPEAQIISFPFVWQTTDASRDYPPSRAESILLEMYTLQNPTKLYRRVVNRPADGGFQTVPFAEVTPTGWLHLSGIARSMRDGSGQTVGVLEDYWMYIDSSLPALQSGILVCIPPSRISITIRESVTAPASPTSAEYLIKAGKTVELGIQGWTRAHFLPPGSLKWEIVSGSEFAALDSDGIFRAIAPGLSVVRLTEQVTGVNTELSIRVQS